MYAKLPLWIGATASTLSLGLNLLSAAERPGGGAAVAATPQSIQRPLLDYALQHDGNATRGHALFNNLQRSGCANCHSTDGSSSKAGPDLSSIGDKFPRRELIRAIL